MHCIKGLSKMIDRDIFWYSVSVVRQNAFSLGYWKVENKMSAFRIIFDIFYLINQCQKFVRWLKVKFIFPTFCWHVRPSSHGLRQIKLILKGNFLLLSSRVTKSSFNMQNCVQIINALHPVYMHYNIWSLCTNRWILLFKRCRY